jgi:hypothetical protein
MYPRDDKSLDLIGKALRDAWCDLVISPLPERIARLLEELGRAEKIPPQRAAQKQAG